MRIKKNRKTKKDAVSFKVVTLTDLIGQTEADATVWILGQGLRCRITRRDAEEFMGTMDFRNDRVNLEIDNGKVTSVDIG